MRREACGSHELVKCRQNTVCTCVYCMLRSLWCHCGVIVVSSSVEKEGGVIHLSAAAGWTFPNWLQTAIELGHAAGGWGWKWLDSARKSFSDRICNQRAF